MKKVFAFGVYGTLVDVRAIDETLSTIIGERGGEFSRLWRDRQLQFAFRRTLMNDYRDWLVVTRDALETTCRMMQITLTDQERVALMTRYIELPAFDDVKPALTALGHSEHRMSAFSNALPGALRALLQHAGIADLLQTPISVHDIRSLKPDPAAYAHFNAKTGSVAEDTWLVSSNPYDICGAVAFGWRAAWLRRSSRSVFDRWEYMPTETIDSLSDLTHIP